MVENEIYLFDCVSVSSDGSEVYELDYKIYEEALKIEKAGGLEKFSISNYLKTAKHQNIMHYKDKKIEPMKFIQKKNKIKKVQK